MTKTIELLNTFLRGEISAVETHKMAIEKLSKASFIATLRDNLGAHEARVKLLSDEIVKHGGTPATGSGIWGTFAKLMEGGAALFGEKAAISVLEDGEDKGRDAYKDGLEDTTPPVRDFIQALYAKQMKSHDVMSKLKKTMGGKDVAAPPTM